MELELDINKVEKELKNPSPTKKDNYDDLKDKAFEHGEDTPRGRQERSDYRKGVRRGIGGSRTYEEHR